MKSPVKDAQIKPDPTSQARVLDALRTPNGFIPRKHERAWHEILLCLPPGLQAALLMELEAGNRVTSFSMSDWPDKGSVVVSVAERFRPARTRGEQGVTWRAVNDPHFWREELSCTVDGVAHLIIT